MEDPIKKGIKVEMEHKPTYDWFLEQLVLQRVPSIEELAERIAMDHVAENKEYYTYLQVIEDIMKKKEK